MNAFMTFEQSRHARTAKGLALVLTLAAGLAAGACSKQEEAEAKTANAPAPAVEVGRENIIAVTEQEIATGPLISGTLTAENEATVKAEVAGAVLQVTAEVGNAVKQGQLLARLEDTTQREAVLSAESAVKSAENALDVAQREATRTANLVKGGALPEREVETTQNAVTGAQAQLANAKAQLATARKQLDKATVRSPMSGIVAERAANRGDIVSTGDPLYKVIAPSSMQLNASVPAEALAAIRVGLPVDFTVRGYDTPFEGRIERISPTADPVTRQVSIYVSIPNKGGRLVAGLFAEGRVARQTKKALVVPAAAVNTSSKEPWVMRIKDGKAEKVTVSLGLRDEQTERVELASGVQAGDQLLVGASQGLTPGTPVKVRETASQQGQ
jgi:membrane fusion protein (multidrug efflux system)